MGNARFCPACGAQAKGTGTAPVAYVNPGAVQPNYFMQMQAQMDAYRASNIALISEIYHYFEPVKAEFKQMYELQEKVVPALTRRSQAALVWGILCIVFAASAYWLFSFFPAVSIFLAAVGVFLILLYILKGVHSNKKLAESKAEMLSLQQYLYEYYNGCGYTNLFGFEYADPVVLSTLYQIMKSGRANTISEAIQQFIADIRNDQLQSYSEEIIRQIRSVRRWAKAGVGLSAANLGVGIMSWLL